jgi:hypothetical protein
MLTLLVALFLAVPGGVSSQSASAPSKTLSGRNRSVTVDLLPPELRARGREILQEKDDETRAELANNLAEDEPEKARTFLLTLLDQDRSAKVRLEIIDEIGLHSNPATRRSLEKHAGSDPDVAVALLALERLRQQVTEEARQLLNRRGEMARRAGDVEGSRLIAAEQERWISIVRGTMLPSFLRVPPAPWSLMPSDRSIRVLAFGDYGDGSESQKSTADAMLKFHRTKPFDFAVTLGDNFYEEGMMSPADPRWKSWWEDLYGPLAIKFYGVLGNHDWKLSDSPAAEVLYSGKSQSWNLPSPYYTFSAGPVQFFALDTNEVSAAQLLWLEDELKRSPARWKVAYGHHPIFSAGKHGDTPALVRRLLPVLRGRADVYFCGHDHDMQHLRSDGGIEFFVCGAGGAETRPLHKDPRSLFARDTHGFAVIEADNESLKVTFFGTDLAELYSYTMRK